MTRLVHPSQAPVPTLQKAEFWVAVVDEQGDEISFQSHLVPRVPEWSCYGCRLQTGGVEGVVKFREVFELPAEPESWWLEYGEFSTSAAARERRAWITESFAALANGWIDNSWCVVKGDPKGVHSIKVYVNGHFIKRFQFELVDFDRRCRCCKGSGNN